MGLRFPFLQPLLLVQALACLGLSSPALAQTTASRLASLPQHFGLGLQSGNSDLTYLKSSGVPWDYRYQYINNGWSNWSSPSAQIGYQYSQASLNSGYVPVFTWYVAQSSGAGGCGGLSWLQNPANTRDYFSQFGYFLQTIGTNQPVILHLEPDLWGFFQQCDNNNPSNIVVSVGSSGYAPLAGLSNNVVGFAQAFVKLRDTYAPNVLLAWHASAWGPNGIGYLPLNANNGNPVSAANGLVAFYRQLNAPFDLIFTETCDADAAFPGSTGSHGWMTETYWSQYQQYLSTLSQGTGAKCIVWQLPSGNTLYRSCNNTTYHYQDNTPEYFLTNRQHMVSLSNSGVIALLFGSGQLGQDTDAYDWSNDGITNPTPINGNTNVALYADDDGGFLRVSAAAYYTNPISFTPSPISWSRTGNQLSLQWSNGSGVLLSTTNPTQSVSNWMPVVTNPSLPYIINVSSNVPQKFFRPGDH